MDHITHEMRLANWKSIIEHCHARPEGKTIKQWLSEQSIPEKQYYYWQRRVRKEAYDQMKNSLPAMGNNSSLAFAELPYRTTALVMSSDTTTRVISLPQSTMIPLLS